MGSAFTDQDSNYVSEDCSVAEKCGDASQLKASTGTIEMMREAYDGTLEEFDLGATKQIDGNGTWCIQVPMNLDYITTNEKGDIVRTKDPSKGIPTRAKVRFKITLEGDNEYVALSHPLTYFVPANLTNEDVVEDINASEVSYGYGLSKEKFEETAQKLTYWGNNPEVADDKFREWCMRDMLWNCVYSVKNYIPRIQMVAGDEQLINKNVETKRIVNEIDDSLIFEVARGYNHTGIKGVNKSNAKHLNPFPYNKINLGLTIGAWSQSQSLWNSIESWFSWTTKAPHLFSYSSYPWQSRSWFGRFYRLFGFSRPFFYNYRTYENVASEDEIMARTLENNDSVAYDFYNDWVNGTLYFPKVRFDYNYNGNAPSVTPKADGNELTKGNIYLNDACSLDYSVTPDLKGENVVFASKTNACIVNSVFGENGTINGIAWNETSGGSNGVNNFASHTASLNLNSGFVYESVGTSDENNVIYTYSPILGTLRTEANSKRIMLPGFRTDIILLGSVDDNSLLGIPSVKNLKLPSTTANIVEMYNTEIPFNPSGEPLKIYDNGTFSDEAENPVGQESEIGENEIYIEGDSGSEIDPSTFVGLADGRALYKVGAYWGTAEYTPWYVYSYRWFRYWGGWWTDWWNGWGATPQLINSKTFFTDRKLANMNERDMGLHSLLGQGLFFGRNAFSSFTHMFVTKPKSCVNLMRICELSVTNENSLAFTTYGSKNWINADTIGVITDEQITTPLSRSLFATLNNNKLVVKDDDGTSLPKYKLSYMNINGFDGLLNGLVVKEYYDPANVKVRLSETTSKDYKKFKYGKLARFVFGARDVFFSFVNRFPVTENSFYFYFGINGSHTAIDKFNQTFGKQ